MNLKSKLSNAINLAKNNKRVIENYFFMTVLQILNSFFYLLIYPYLIRVFGAETYGLFVFATSVSLYFSFVVNFGFDLPATKELVENLDNKHKVNEILSRVFYSKLILLLISLFIFVVLSIIVPIIRDNFWIFFVCFLQVFSSIIFPQWYFQAIQNMRIVTFIQLFFKILSLPLIFVLLRSKDDLLIYAAIVTGSSILGGVVAFFILIVKYKIQFLKITVKNMLNGFKNALPFFISLSAGTIKEQSIPLLIGSFFGMKEVAIFDLANKLIIIPRTIFASLNSAIFPVMVKNIQISKIRKILKAEYILSLIVIGGIIAFGKFAVEILGGEEMSSAYYVAIFLSFTVASWLIVGAYLNFVFIPNNKFYIVSKNQLLALTSFFVYFFVGILIYKSIIVFAIAIGLSAITEIIYCYLLTKKYKLL